MADEIVKVIDALCEKFGLAIDWTSENVLPYAELLCKRMITYELWSSVVYMFVAILLLIFTFFAIKRFLKKDEDDEWLMEYGENIDFSVGLIAIILGTIALVFGVCMLFGEVPDIITCLTFPEKIIWNEIQTLLE